MILVLLSAFMVIVSFIQYDRWKHSYWQLKNIPQLNPEFLFGDTKNLFIQKLSFAEFVTKTYGKLKKLNLKHCGLYMFYKPIYFPLDLPVLKSILTTDSEYFADHGNFYTSKNDILTRNIFSSNGQQWKDIRVKLTPTFTSGKMKMMFEIMLELTETLNEIIGSKVDSKAGVDIRDVVSCFTTDIIGNCGFGIECNSMTNPDVPLRKVGKQILKPRPVKMIIEEVIPWKLLTSLNYKSLGQDVENFFKETVSKTIEHREKNNVYRKDFMHLLIQLKNQGKLSDDGNISKNGNLIENFTVDDIAAQCFIFFVAGHDTASSTITNALYNLSQHQDIQEKVREEIRNVLEKHEGKITYDALMEMNYTDKVIQETLRLHPSLSFTPRICTKTYKMPGSDLIIDKGTDVMIPTLGIHMDPEYYPNPELFDPERFSLKSKELRPEFAYIPFGAGPRKCIGLRFGLMQIKVCLTSLLNDYNFTLNEKTPAKFTLLKNSFVTQVSEKIFLTVTRVKKGDHYRTKIERPREARS